MDAIKQTNQPVNAVPVKQVPSFHVELSGTPYQVGQMQGQMVRQVPGWLAFIRSGQGTFSGEAFQAVSQRFARFCPGLNEEIQGLADAAEVPAEAVIYYATTTLRSGHCSHFAVLPSLTAAGRTLVGRSYEFSESSDDLRLCTTRIAGKYAHIGFSIMLFGRGDGLNEHGLSVTTSSGGMPVGPMRPAIQDGFQFWAVVRTILENCRNVDEALALVADFPLGCNVNLILADAAGQAALVEIYGPHLAVRRIDAGTPQQFVASANHYTQAEMDPYQPARMAHSLTRLQAVHTFIQAEAPQLTPARLQRFLGQEFPAGPCCHYYEEYFGTLRSLVIDPAARSVQVCFGTPAANPWHAVDFNTRPTPAPFMTNLPQAKAAPDFWAMV